jgi:hypothetical protein
MIQKSRKTPPTVKQWAALVVLKSKSNVIRGDRISFYFSFILLYGGIIFHKLKKLRHNRYVEPCTNAGFFILSSDNDPFHGNEQP